MEKQCTSPTPRIQRCPCARAGSLVDCQQVFVISRNSTYTIHIVQERLASTRKRTKYPFSNYSSTHTVKTDPGINVSRGIEETEPRKAIIENSTSFFVLPALRLEESAGQKLLEAYSCSRTVSAAALLPALKGISNQNSVQQHCIDKGIYLLGEQTDIPAAYAFKVSDLKLEVLELNNSDSIEPNIKKY
jgi:hypothetical protein